MRPDIRLHGLPASALAAFATGSVAVLAMPPFGLWPVMLAAVAVLYILHSRSIRPLHSGVLGWAYGFGYFVFGLYWIGNALLVDGNEFSWAWPLAVAGLPVVLAFYPAAALYAAKRFFSGQVLSTLLAFSAILSLSEWLRGNLFTGFPWNLSAYAWKDALPIVQIVSVGGVYFLSFLTVFWGASIGFVLLRDAGRAARLVVFIISMASLAATFGFGAARLAGADRQQVSGLNVQIVQPSIPQAEKWQQEKIWDHFNTLVAMSYPQDNSDGDEAVTFIVWPETAISMTMLNVPEARSLLETALSAHLGPAYLLTGALRIEPGESGEPDYANSLVILDKNLEIAGYYDKAHLVPFGEYIPFRKLVPFGPVASFSDMIAGSGPKRLTVGEGYSISPIVCYEVIFPGKITSRSNSDILPHIIVNVTNDAWYGDSTGPQQHFNMALFRAVEEGVSVIRAANNGISGIIDPYGMVITRIPLNHRGSTMVTNVPVTEVHTLVYRKLGYLLFWAAIAFFLAFSLSLQYSNKGKS